mmetsp:Transcript_135168/g.432009  ORF Transcript_135168/g.432009 Transcript_135168/m.432009 type:complete len:266 (-) Transcript_135168:922-1719(-)
MLRSTWTPTASSTSSTVGYHWATFFATSGSPHMSSKSLYPLANRLRKSLSLGAPHNLPWLTVAAGTDICRVNNPSGMLLGHQSSWPMAESARFPNVVILQDFPHLLFGVDRRRLGSTPLLWDGCMPTVDQVEVEGGLIADSLLVSNTCRPPSIVLLPQFSKASTIRSRLTEHLVTVLPEDNVDEDTTHDEPGLLIQRLISGELVGIPQLQLVANIVVLHLQHLNDHLGLGNPRTIESSLCNAIQMAIFKGANTGSDLLVPPVQHL